MIVPSRSMSTAREFALVEIMFKTRDQLVTRDGRRAQFTDNHGAGVIGDLRGFERGGVAYQRQGKHRDCGVAGAGYIENIPRLGRDVVWSLAFFEKHHSVFAERDQKILRRPFPEQVFSGSASSNSLVGDNSESRSGIPAARNCCGR